MKKLYRLVFALMVMLSMTMSVQALEQKTIDRQNSLGAYAYWTKTTTDEMKIITSLEVIQLDDGTHIDMRICTASKWGLIMSCKVGSKVTQEMVFSMDKKLDSANLKAVQIDLLESACYECEPVSAGTATIEEATWQGTGEVSESSNRYISKYNDYIDKGSYSNFERMATARVSINHEDLGTSSYARLFKSKSTIMNMQK